MCVKCHGGEVQYSKEAYKKENWTVGLGKACKKK